MRYVVCNGAEGEPSTFKDRALMRTNPYQLVEGLLIAAFAVGAESVYVASKATFGTELDGVTRAAAEMQDAGICGDCEINIVAGPADYLYGEETALLEVIEGRSAAAPALPAVPARPLRVRHHDGMGGQRVAGGRRRAHGQSHPRQQCRDAQQRARDPRRGVDWFRSRGTPESPGTIVCTVAGDVVAPDVGEVELGTPLGNVIEAVGSGVGAGRTVKAVLPGVAAPFVTDMSIPVSYEGFERVGSAMGAGGYQVLDDTACMVGAALAASRFLADESCGQCPPCKLGSIEITRRLERLEAGTADTRDVEALGQWVRRVSDGNRCYLAVQEQLVVGSALTTFADEVAAHVALGRCPLPRPVVLPRLVDLHDGIAAARRAVTGDETKPPRISRSGARATR